jgi:hypothetical protein
MKFRYEMRRYVEEDDFKAIEIRKSLLAGLYDKTLLTDYDEEEIKSFKRKAVDDLRNLGILPEESSGKSRGGSSKKLKM